MSSLFVRGAELSKNIFVFQEHGLVLVGEDEGQLQLVSKDMSEVLRGAGEGNLERKLQALDEEKQSLEEEVSRSVLESKMRCTCVRGLSGSYRRVTSSQIPFFAGYAKIYAKNEPGYIG